MDKKTAGQVLFQNGLKGKEIASLLGVSENTVSSWKRKEKWDEKLSQLSLLKETAEESVFDLINWNLYVLKERKKEWESSGELKLIERGDIDALTKLFASVRGRERKWSDLVLTVRDFLSYLSEQDHNLAQKIIPFTDMFLNERRTDNT